MHPRRTISSQLDRAYASLCSIFGEDTPFIAEDGVSSAEPPRLPQVLTG